MRLMERRRRRGQRAQAWSQIERSGSKPVPKVSTVGSGVVSGAWFSGGVWLWDHLNHTFALKLCPQQISGGQPPAVRGGAGWFEAGPGVFYRSVRPHAHTTLHGGGSQRAVATVCLFESVFPQVKL